MHSPVAVEEFATVLQLGVHALKAALISDGTPEAFESEINELLFLADRITDVSDRLQEKARKAADRTSDQA